jgi:hypothetical protein
MAIESANGASEPQGNARMSPQRIVFPMATKGGVGKTMVMSALTEWYLSNQIPVRLCDITPWHHTTGALSAMFKDAIKIPGGSDSRCNKLLDASMSTHADVILVDAGSAAPDYQMPAWVKLCKRNALVAGLRLRWTAIGVVNGDIDSTFSVLAWGESLGKDFDYVIVHNFCDEENKSSWEHPAVSRDVEQFRQIFSPTEIRLQPRRQDLQLLMRMHSVPLSEVADGATQVPDLQGADLMYRARYYRKEAFNQFALAREALLP